MRGLAAIDPARFAIEKPGVEIALDRLLDAIGIGHDAIAHREGPLGRLDQPVQVIEALGLRRAQALEQRENDQRCETLRRRRRVEHGAGLERDRQRLGEARPAAFEIAARDRAADAIEIGGDLARDIAAVVVIEPGLGEMIERRRERRLPQRRAGIGRATIDQECRREAGDVLELGELLRREPGLAAGDGVAVLGVADRRSEQVGQRQARAMGAGDLERQHPAGDRAGHGERRERTARRDRLMLAVKLAPRIGAGAAGSHQRAHAPRRLVHEPEPVAADLGHVRVDRGDGCRHRHHGLERVAARGQGGAPRLDGGVMRGGDDALAMSGGVEVHGSGCHANRKCHARA